MKIAPDNCIYLSQSATVHLPFQLLDRLTLLKSRMNLTKEYDNMVAFVYNSRALLSIANTDFYEIHIEVKRAYEVAVKNVKSKSTPATSQISKDQTITSLSSHDSSYHNTLQFIIIEGT